MLLAAACTGSACCVSSPALRHAPQRTRRSVFPRRLSYCKPVAAAPLVGSSGAPPTDTTGDGQEQGYAVGAWVYDSSHKTSRGWGEIMGAAPAAADGTLRWRVKFDRGARICAIKQTYLALPCVPYYERVPAAAGRNGWTCKLDGASGAVTIPTERLHATEAPPEDAQQVVPFEASQLEGELPLPTVHAWLEAYADGGSGNTTGPIALVRCKPDAALWCDVLLGQRSVEGLSDEDVMRLAYLLTDPPSDAAGLRERLQAKAAAAWTIKYSCSRSAACGCPFGLEVRHAAGASTVAVWQTQSHQFHNPSSLEDLALLKMDSLLEGLCRMMLLVGANKQRIVHVLNEHAAAHNSGSLEAAADGRYSITSAQVHAVAKKMRREQGHGLATDAAAVAAQLAEYRKAGCVREYQPYKMGREGRGEQALVIMLQAPFQARMLAEFGQRVVQLDATWGTNKYGYPLTALLVQDEHARGVPVGFMISTGEDANLGTTFLRKMQEGAREHGDGGFKYGHIMIDHSPTEIAAVQQLVSTGDAQGWLLCYFHFLQAWERFLRTKESGVGSSEARNHLIHRLGGLAKTKSEALFQTKLSEFNAECVAMACRPVMDHMATTYMGIAQRWAWFGRLDMLDLDANTNNGLERQFGVVKWDDLQRNAQCTLQKLVDVLLGVTVVRHMRQRAQMLAGRTKSDQRRQAAKREEWARELASKAEAASGDGAPPGLVMVPKHSASGQWLYRVCLADMTCECKYSACDLCIHVLAAALAIGFTPALRQQAADWLVAKHAITVDEAGEVCSIEALASAHEGGKQAHCMPREWQCTCQDRALHGTCCHLLGACQLPEFEDVEEPAAAAVLQEGEPDKDQAIRLRMHRTFQEASQEPLGQDYGAAEMEALRAAGRAGTTAIRRAKSNADPLVAQVRRDLAYAAGTVATLPAGEERDALAQAAADLRSQAERAAADAKLPLTAVRAGKVVRRQQGRPEGRQPMDRVVKALHPGRSGRKRQRQKSKGGEALEQSDEFQPRRKKGKPSHKTRGPTVPDNKDGTFMRNGAPHHRRPKRK